MSLKYVNLWSYKNQFLSLSSRATPEEISWKPNCDDALRERNALHYWWYMYSKIPSENKKKEHFMIDLMFITLPVTVPLKQSAHAKYHVRDILFILGLLNKIQHLLHLKLRTQLCKWWIVDIRRVENLHGICMMTYMSVLTMPHTHWQKEYKSRLPATSYPTLNMHWN